MPAQVPYKGPLAYRRPKAPGPFPPGKGGLPLNDCFVAPRSQTNGMLVRRALHSSQIQASKNSITYA